jgi:hypothetical protein
MMMKMTTNTSALALITALIAGPALAQQAAPETAAAAAKEDELIVVTGSNIRGATDSGAIAVTVLGADELEAFGVNSTGEIFENIAQAGAAEINGASDGPNDARGDVATINLRGLGTGNTLVLLNGRRIAAHAVNQDIGSTPRQITNVNAFPAAGIDRVESTPSSMPSSIGCGPRCAIRASKALAAMNSRAMLPSASSSTKAAPGCSSPAAISPATAFMPPNWMASSTRSTSAACWATIRSAPPPPISATPPPPRRSASSRPALSTARACSLAAASARAARP